jgi:hypothetical protein
LNEKSTEDSTDGSNPDDGETAGPLDQDEVGKIKGKPEDIGPIADNDLASAKQQLETSIRRRKEENKWFPRGSRNGNTSDRINDKEYKNHKDQIEGEEKILKEVTRRLNERTIK